MFTWRAQRVEKEAGPRQTKHLPNAEEEGTTIYSGESGEIATEVATEAVEEDSRRRRRLPENFLVFLLWAVACTTSESLFI